MSFLRVGDTFAYDPRTLHPLEYEWADERSVDEIAGFSVRLASQSGAHELEETNIRVTRAMTLQMAGSVERMNRIMGCLVDAGVWVIDGTGWRLLNDTAYLHLLTQDELDRQRARGRDERNPLLTVPAKLRDGDNCRYCGRVVNWNDRRSNRGGTWEHLDITVQPTPLHLFVVCCLGCNRAPADRPDLQAPPTKPYYSNITKAFVRKHLDRWPTPSQIDTLYPGLRTWSTENAASRQRTVALENATQNDTQRPENASESAGVTTTPTPPKQAQSGRSSPEQARNTGSTSHESRYAGSGRVGTGMEGPGSVVPGLDVPGRATPKPNPRKRSRRSKPKEES